MLPPGGEMPGEAFPEGDVEVGAVMLAARVWINKVELDLGRGENGLELDPFDDQGLKKDGWGEIKNRSASNR